MSIDYKINIELRREDILRLRLDIKQIPREDSVTQIPQINSSTLDNEYLTEDIIINYN